MTEPVIDPSEIERILAREAATWSEAMSARKALRALHADPSSKRLTSIKLKELKSDMKRTTTLLRRLRDFKAENKDAVIVEIESLNLSKFVQEGAQNIVASLLEGKTKMADVLAIVCVCSAMHQRYDAFMVDLLTEVRKKWVLTAMQAPADETQDAARVRVMTKFTCELFLVGITSEWKLFRWVLTQVAQTYSTGNATVVMTALSVVNLLAKTLGAHMYGAGPWLPDDPTPLNIALSKIQHSDELMVPPAACAEMRKVSLDFAKSCAAVLKSSTDEMEDIWKLNMDAIQTTGELPDNLKESFGNKKKICDKLYGMLSPLVMSHPDRNEVVLTEVPTLAKLQATLASQQTSNSIVFLSGLASFYTVGDIAWSSEALYDTDDMQRFYEEFDELVIPVEDAVAEFKNEQKEISNVGSDEEAIDAHLGTLYRECVRPDIATSVHTWAGVFFDSSHALLRYRTRGVKDIGKSFLLMCKKRLLKHMRESPVDRLECLPGLCRLAALVHQSGDPSICDLGELFAKGVEDDLYKCLIAEPTHGGYELKNKLKLSMTLCETIKFRTIQTGGILRILSACGEENNLKKTPHVLEVLANMLESVGPFLMRNAMTRARFDSILNNLTKNIRLIGGEYELRLGSGITLCREALTKSAEIVAKETPARTSKDTLRTPHERYLRHLLFNELSKYTRDSVIAQVLKFDWGSKEMRKMMTRTLRKAYRVNYTNMVHYAYVIYEISEHYDAVGTWIVDDIIERCRQDLELRLPSQRRTQQKRHVDMRLFGDLYVLGVVHESTLFYMLYMLVLYRHTFDMGRDFSRVRLICNLLDACGGAILEQGTSRKRMQNFLFHFYMLVHTKQRPFPVDINFAIGDTMDMVRSYYPMASSLEKFPDTPSDAEKLFQKYLHKMTRSRDPVNDYYNYFTNTGARALHPIHGSAQFYGFDDDVYEDVGGEEETAAAATAAPSQLEREQTTTAPATKRRPGPSAESIAAREEDEFDKLFKDSTKESYDAVKQASSLKSMSGRRTTVNVGPQMMQLQSMLRTQEYATTLGTVSADRSAVSVGIVIRNKDAGKKVSSASTSGPTVLVRMIDIPVESVITQSQRQNIAQNKKDEESIKRAVLGRVREQQKEDMEKERPIPVISQIQKDVRAIPELLKK